MNRIESFAGDRVVSSLNICQSAMGMLLDVVLWLPRFWIARSELGNLAIMTERDCQDIGLTGCEIERYLTQPNGFGGVQTASALEDRRVVSAFALQRLRCSTLSSAFVSGGPDQPSRPVIRSITQSVGS